MMREGLNKFPEIVKYNKKEKGAACGCGGAVMFGGSGTMRLPLGFGDLSEISNKSGFGAEMLNMRGWTGVCMECGQEIFAYTSRRKSVKSIKIRGLR